MRHEKEASYWATIYIAGDYAKALKICQEFCDEISWCVTVEPTTYVYKGGAESGVRVGIINYPRFPSSSAILFAQAVDLGRLLLDRLDQGSFSVVAKDRTEWFSRRPGDQLPASKTNSKSEDRQLAN